MSRDRLYKLSPDEAHRYCTALNLEHEGDLFVDRGGYSPQFAQTLGPAYLGRNFLVASKNQSGASFGIEEKVVGSLLSRIYESPIISHVTPVDPVFAQVRYHIYRQGEDGAEVIDISDLLDALSLSESRPIDYSVDSSEAQKISRKRLMFENSFLKLRTTLQTPSSIIQRVKEVSIGSQNYALGNVDHEKLFERVRNVQKLKQLGVQFPSPISATGVDYESRLSLEDEPALIYPHSEKFIALFLGLDPFIVYEGEKIVVDSPIPLYTTSEIDPLIRRLYSHGFCEFDSDSVKREIDKIKTKAVWDTTTRVNSFLSRDEPTNQKEERQRKYIPQINNGDKGFHLVERAWILRHVAQGQHIDGDTRTFQPQAMASRWNYLRHMAYPEEMALAYPDAQIETSRTLPQSLLLEFARPKAAVARKVIQKLKEGPQK